MHDILKIVNLLPSNLTLPYVAIDGVDACRYHPFPIILDMFDVDVSQLWRYRIISLLKLSTLDL
jgi:hypothetical protein